MQYRKVILILVVGLLLMVACNPQLSTPNVTLPKSYIYGAEGKSDTVGVSERWWEMFDDSLLNRLVERALANNRNLAVAVSRIEEARLSRKTTRAAFLPSFSVAVSGGASGESKTPTVQSYSIKPQVSWEVPLFGELRHTTAEAEANLSYAEWQWRGVRLSLAAEVATTYFTLLQYRRDLDIAERSAALRRESATLIDSIFGRGMASGVHREQALSLVYTAEADIPLYRRAVAQTLLSLDVLLGSNPDSLAHASFDARLITEYRPLDIPAGLPSDLLSRRPDVMQAWWQVRRAGAAVGVARSARLPLVSLTADGGRLSDDVVKVFTGRNWVWSALATLSQPVFGFGRLRDAERIAREQYRQAVLDYEQACIEAVADVEKALVSIATYRNQTAKYRELVVSNSLISQMSNALYYNGLSAYLDVIDAERTLYDSQMQFSNVVAQQYINYVDLCRALGGGWVDVPANK